MSLSPSVEKRLLALRRQGLTKSEIARKLGIHRNTVARYTDRADDVARVEEVIEIAGVSPNYVAVLGSLLRKRLCPLCRSAVPFLACQSEVRCVQCLHAFRL